MCRKGQKRAEKGKGGLNMKLQLSDVGRWTTGPCPWRTTPKSKGKGPANASRQTCHCAERVKIQKKKTRQNGKTGGTA